MIIHCCVTVSVLSSTEVIDWNRLKFMVQCICLDKKIEPSQLGSTVSKNQYTHYIVYAEISFCHK